jgi:hypothetical protein
MRWRGVLLNRSDGLDQIGYHAGYGLVILTLELGMALLIGKVDDAVDP